MPISMRDLFQRRGAPVDFLSLRHCLEQHVDGVGTGLRQANEKFLTLDTGGGFPCGCKVPDSIQVDIPIVFNKGLAGVLPAWVRVDQADRKRAHTLEGVLMKVKITDEDFPLKPWHKFYDWNFFVYVDQQYRFLLNDTTREHHSEKILEPDAKAKDIIENEWDSAEVPLWAVPQAGSRVWMVGRWIYDCGHPPEVVVAFPPGTQKVYTTRRLRELEAKGGVIVSGDPSRLGRHRMELHPLRAMASFRSEAALLRGNSRPTQANNAILIMSRQGGYIQESIDDRDYAFDLPLPPKPRPDAVPATRVEEIVGTLPGGPRLTPFPAHNPQLMRVEIPLAGTGLGQYGAIISAGWNDPDRKEAAKIRRYRVTIDEVVWVHPGGLGRQMVIFLGVNGRWHRADVMSGGSSVDFTTELNLHTDDSIRITATGFVKTGIFPFMNKASGVPAVRVSQSSTDEQAVAEAKKIRNAFVTFPPPLSFGNEPIRMFVKAHRPVVAKSFKEKAEDNEVRGETKGHDYMLKYTITEI